MDALFNYLTVAGFSTPSFNWPPSAQMIGKDILKFHAIYWPAFLIALDLELPERIVCHSHWTIDGLKMSKSKGNVVDPFRLKQDYGSECVRYYLLREAVLQEDGNFSEMEMKRSVNSELSDCLGNILSRCTSVALNPSQELPSLPLHLNQHSKSCLEMIYSLPSDCLGHFQDFRFNIGVDTIMKALRCINAFIQECKPWQLKKENNLEQLNQVLFVSLESVRVSSILLQPLVPRTSTLVLNKLNSPSEERSWKDAYSTPNSLVSNPRSLSTGSSVVFPRIQNKK